MRRFAASWLAVRRQRGQRGQVLVIMALLSVFLLSLLGLMVDSVRLYTLSAQAERAAEAAALAGALYMPGYLRESNPAPDGESAEKRACDVLAQNGITACPAPPGQVGGQVSPVQDNPYGIRVTVTLQADVFFLALVSPGLATSTVSRSAAAEFLPPINLGSRDGSFGGSLNLWAYITGPQELQENGDAYTPIWQEGPTDIDWRQDIGGKRYPFSRWAKHACPDPTFCTNHYQWPGGAIANPDHPLQGGFTGPDGKPGYNYQIVIPQGASMDLEIYNPAFDPPNATTGDDLASACLDPSYLATGTCKTDDPTEYMQMTYSLYSAPLSFEQNPGNLIVSTSYDSLDFYPGDQAKYICPSTQGYDFNTKACEDPPGARFADGWVPLAANLAPGTYRLVVQAGNSGYGQHGYGIRLKAAGGTPAGAGIWGWNNMAVRFMNGHNDSYTYDLAEIPAAYAGKTLYFNLFDAGDAADPDTTASNTSIAIEILDPSGTPIEIPDNTVRQAAPNGQGQRLDFLTNFYDGSSNDNAYNGLWGRIPVTIPADYNPAPGDDWWQIKYISNDLPIAADTITISVSLGGNPPHLISEIP